MEGTFETLIPKILHQISSTEVMVSIMITISILITKLHELAENGEKYRHENGKLKKFKYFVSILYNMMTGFLLGLGTLYLGEEYAPDMNIKIIAVVSIFVASIGEPVAEILKEGIIKFITRMTNKFVEKPPKA